jgi:hypothetical protein
MFRAMRKYALRSVIHKTTPVTFSSLMTISSYFSAQETLHDL